MELLASTLPVFHHIELQSYTGIYFAGREASPHPVTTAPARLPMVTNDGTDESKRASCLCVFTRYLQRSVREGISGENETLDVPSLRILRGLALRD